MQTRPLGNTGIELPILSFGASSLGAEFRSITFDEAMRSTRTALDLGMNFIDTSAYYGRGMSEIMLGLGLREIPRDSYLLGTKLGRYSDKHFDFSAKRVDWLKEPEEVREAARKAARHCEERGVDIAQLALQFACAHPNIASMVAGSANPDNIRKWADWLAKPIDESLLAEVLAIFEPVKDIGHQEGLPENN